MGKTFTSPDSNDKLGECGLYNYVSSVEKKQTKTTIAIGKNDKTKRFHIMLTIERVDIPIPPNLKGQIESMAFDISCGINSDRISEVFKEAEKLRAQGYEEEEAPCGI